MKTATVCVTLDHYLVARAESRATGANAHYVHGLLGKYFGLLEAAETDPACVCRVEAIEQQLRSVCCTAEFN